MRVRVRFSASANGRGRLASPPQTTRSLFFRYVAVSPLILLLLGMVAQAQVSVVTAHNDIARTGQNLQETVLTPSTVSTTTFGKLFSQPVNGEVFAQPLYVPQVTVPGLGVHNVIYVATTSGNPNMANTTGIYVGDSVYAFDADNSGGANANPLWSVSLLTNTTPAGTYTAYSGVLGTPVIDLSTNTMYLVSSEVVSATSTQIFRLHALDITTGAEKFGGPVQIQASVAGTGSASSNGVLTFNPLYQLQRSALLELNGVIYVAFGSHNDEGPWHGWLFSYSAATLQQLNVFCTTPNGSGGGIWMGGAGLVAEVYNSSKPYGRMFVATGNGSYSPAAGNYGMSVLDFDLTDGIMTVEDEFTPWNKGQLDANDGDLGSGGPVLLPTQTMASGKILNPLLQVGKAGMFYILDRDNNTDGSNNSATEYSPAGLGGYNATADQVVQEVQTPESGANNWGAGVWGSEAYWNNNIYSGGVIPGATSSLSAYSFVNGVLSTAPTSQSTVQYKYSGPTPSISASGTQKGIVWAISNPVGGTAALTAYDATNLANLLYSSTQNPSRDNPGQSAELTVPTIANGKVYVGAIKALAVYGLLAGTPVAVSPAISAPQSVFSGSETITITDTTSGAQIFYTTNGTTPTVSSTLYTGPFTISSTETITAIASATGYLQSAPAAATFTASTSTANPVFSLAAGSYSGAQVLTITDGSSGAVTYYTFDGTTPTTSSYVYSQPIGIPVSETIQAIAVAPGLQPSSLVSAAFTITPPYAISFPEGFTNSQSSGQMQFNGSTALDDFRLQLTNGGTNEAGSAFYTTPVNIQSFTTDFTFQLSNPVGDGITFTIQPDGPTALGTYGKDLGYGGIHNAVAIAFNLYNNTISYTLAGGNPALSAVSLANTGINLASGDYMNVHLTYDGQFLCLTITDEVMLASWSYAFVSNIPYHMGANTAYVGFTGGTGGSTASQKLTYWTFLSGLPPVPSFPAGFDYFGLNFRGSIALEGTTYELTNGKTNESSSLFYSTPVDVDSFATSFDFNIAPGSTSTLGDGFTFTIQNAGLSEVGSNGAGLGYASIPASVAIKFDVNTPVGEGADSTGVYVNGASPTVPAIDLTPSGVALGSGDNIHANVTYNGTTLTWTLTDTTLASQPSATNSLAINIPDTIGSNVGYFGFTAGAGTATSVETLTDWWFTNPVP